MDVAGPAMIRCAFLDSRNCVLAEPIGKQIIFSLFDPTRGRLGELTRIAYPDDPISASGWDLSRDGGKIAVVGKTGDTVDILDLKSKQVQVIHPVIEQLGIGFISWSADGKRLYLTGSSRGSGMVVELYQDGRAQILIQSSTQVFLCPSTSPDGRYLAYTYQTCQSNVILLEHF
jgi:WD40 repeat protein